MKTKLKCTVAFIFGAIYFWSLLVMFFGDAESVSLPAAVTAGAIAIGGGMIIIWQTIIFIIELWELIGEK